MWSDGSGVAVIRDGGNLLLRFLSGLTEPGSGT